MRSDLYKNEKSFSVRSMAFLLYMCRLCGLCVVSKLFQYKDRSYAGGNENFFYTPYDNA